MKMNECQVYYVMETWSQFKPKKNQALIFCKANRDIDVVIRYISSYTIPGNMNFKNNHVGGCYQEINHGEYR